MSWRAEHFADNPLRGEELRHGYTLADLDGFTRAALAADRSRAMDYRDRRDIAWSAIAEHLYAAQDPPQPHELIRTGWRAIYAEIRAGRRAVGMGDEQDSEIGSRPRVAAYWYQPPAEPHEDRILDRIALEQILPTLPEYQRDAIHALAALDNYDLAARALLIRYATLTARVSHARRHVRRLWFAPETAPPNKGTDRRVGSYSAPPVTHCPAGHEWAPENTTCPPSRRTRRCRACQRERDASRRGTRRDVA